MEHEYECFSLSYKPTPPRGCAASTTRRALALYHPWPCTAHGEGARVIVVAHVGSKIGSPSTGVALDIGSYADLLMRSLGMHGIFRPGCLGTLFAIYSAAIIALPFISIHAERGGLVGLLSILFAPFMLSIPLAPLIFALFFAELGSDARPAMRLARASSGIFLALAMLYAALAIAMADRFVVLATGDALVVTALLGLSLGAAIAGFRKN